jgi:AcrR family transcriptional regulator
VKPTPIGVADRGWPGNAEVFSRGNLDKAADVTATGETGGGSVPASGGERISRAAYDLFTRQGVRDVGVDAVIAKAGAAKMTLYRNFPSKNDLILDFLRRRERIWTEQWLQHESRLRGERPQDQMLAIFDLFGEWFARPDFEGCVFLTTMMEINDHESQVFQASVEHLARIRAYLRELAEAAGVADPQRVARQWHILMKGSIMSAHEGDTEAASVARELGVMLLRSHGIPVDPAD